MEDSSIDTTFRNARNNKLALSDKGFNSLFRLTKVKPVDDYGNSLLHIVTEHSNTKYVEDLLDAGYDSNQQNKFGKSPWEIAISNKNKSVIDKFVDHRVKVTNQVEKERVKILENEISQFSKKRKVLEARVEELEKSNQSLTARTLAHELNEKQNTSEITMLTRSKTTLLNELTVHKRKAIDLEDENTVLKTTNKRLREENDELKNANKKLKLSVDAFLEASMK